MNRTVLVVDADVNARIIAETLLRSRGLPARAALGGTDACNILEQESCVIAVVVLNPDLAIAGVSGWEFLRQLRSRFDGVPLLSRPRIVAVTGRAESESDCGALRSGADVLLRKPVAPGEFLDTIERLLDSPAAAAVSSEAVPYGVRRRAA